MKQNNLFIYSTIIALVAYFIPWVVAPTSPMTIGAYDLAEWASLHPSMLGTTPALIVSLLLRLQLSIICGLIALYAIGYPYKWIIRTILLIIAIAQLPPLEFFLSERGNINYQQQGILALVSLISSYWILVQQQKARRQFLALILPIIGIITSIWGLSYAMTLLEMSSQSVQLGFGGLVLLGYYLIIAIPLLIQVIPVITQWRSLQPKNQTR